MAKPDDDYGTYGSVPTVMPSGGGAAYASPNAFGAQVGAALQNLGGAAEKFGDQQMEFATKVAQQATEAKANDYYANTVVPAATELRNQYDQLQGQDKVHGYDAYINSVKALKDETLKTAKSPYETQLLDGLMNRHLIGETESAKRELVQSQIQYSNQAMTDRIKAEAGIVSNQKYNDPMAWEDFAKNVHSMFTMKVVDDGSDPNHPETKEAVMNASREAVGAAAVQGISSAMSRGDAAAANTIRQKLAPAIPGYQIPAIDASLHTENMRQTGTNGAKALIAGAPLPHAVGAPPAQVQALMANTAVKHGVNPNDALTLVRIESNNGQNVGKRGDIGQTGKGGDLNTQADNAMIEWKKSTQVADNVFGQKAPAWATYVCYQQGAGGGPALFNADPKARAIDVLTPLYKTAKQARDAICKNGGSDTMSCGDFLSYWQKRFEQNAKHASVEVGHGDKDFSFLNTKLEPADEAKFQTWKAQYAPKDDGSDYDLRGAYAEGFTPDAETGHWPDKYKKPNHPTFSNQSKWAETWPELAGKWADDNKTFIPPEHDLGAAIMKPHEETGETVQPAANPRGNLANFDAKLPDMMARAQAIPNYEVRDAVIKNLKQERADLGFSATAYSSQLINQAQKIAQSPTFTDISQVPSDLMTSLLDEHPETAHYLQVRADQNALKASGGVDPDMKHYGSAVFDLQRDIANGSVTSATELMKHLPNTKTGEKGDLTSAGFDYLSDKLTKDPRTQSELKNVTDGQEYIRRQMDGSRGQWVDEEGKAKWLSAFPTIVAEEKKALAAGKSIGDLYNPESKDWIGNSVKSMFISNQQQAMNIHASGGIKSQTELLDELIMAKDPKQRKILAKQLSDQFGIIDDVTNGGD